MIQGNGSRAVLFLTMTSTVREFLLNHEVDPASVPVPVRIALRNGMVTFESHVVDRNGRLVQLAGATLRGRYEIPLACEWPKSWAGREFSPTYGRASSRNSVYLDGNTVPAGVHVVHLDGRLVSSPGKPWAVVDGPYIAVDVPSQLEREALVDSVRVEREGRP